MEYNKSHIESYVTGKMTEQDRVVFEANLLVDEDLRAMVNGYKLLEVKKGNATKWLELEKTKIESRTLLKNKRWAKFTATAGIVVCLFAVSYQYFRSVNQIPFDFKDAGLPVFMDVEANSMNAIMNAYKTNDIALAKAMLDNLVANYGESDTTRYYQGVFLKEQHQYEEALQYFKPDEITEITLKQKAQMQRAICLSYLGRDEEASVILKNIKEDSTHLFHEKLMK